jgi:hypothetical protein
MRKTLFALSLVAGLATATGAYAHDPVTGAIDGAAAVTGAAIGAAAGVAIGATTGAAVIADDVVTGRPYRYHRHRHCWINRFGERRCRWR